MKFTEEETLFLDRSYQIYKGFNEEKLMYEAGESYNKLITADPFHISFTEYTELQKRGQDLQNWIEEQQIMFDEVENSKSLSWFTDILKNNHSPDTLRYQFLINKMRRPSKIMRVDLSSFPFNSHEAQLRWGGVGHIQNIPKVFNAAVPFEKSETDLLRTEMKEVVAKVLHDQATEENECGIYITPTKFADETKNFVSEIEGLYVMMVSDFNEQNFLFTGEDLIHKESGKKVRIVFRRELTLETLARTEFGRKVIDLYLVEALSFEPDLNLINDAKLGMAFAFDSRTKQFFSDESRKLFLKTSLYDDKFESFNSVFRKDFTSLQDFLDRTSQKERSYIYKYGGYDLSMSFGSSHVYRLDRSKNKANEIILETMNQKPGEWIMQEFDSTRYPVRFAIGDYNDRDSMSISESRSCSARFMLFYLLSDSNKYEMVSGLANFVNDYWKARFKDSNTQTGVGSIITPIRVVKNTPLN